MKKLSLKLMMLLIKILSCIDFLDDDDSPSKVDPQEDVIMDEISRENIALDIVAQSLIFSEVYKNHLL